MTDEMEKVPAEEGSGIEADLSKLAVELLIALNAALVNIRMYPPTSDMIATSVEVGYERLHRLLSRSNKLTLGEANNLLLVNGEKLGEKDQARPPVIAFLASLRRRDIYSITISAGLSMEEFRSFLEVMAEEPERLRARGGLTSALKEQQVENILVNERKYISISEDEEISAIKEREGEDTLLKPREEEMQRIAEKIKDECFIGYIMGRDSRADLNQEALKDILENPPRMGILLRQAVREIVSEIDEPDLALAKIIEGLERAAFLVKELSQPELEEMDTVEIAKAIGFLEPSELKEYLLAKLPVALAEQVARRQVLDNLREAKIFDLLENVLREHESLRSASVEGMLDPQGEERIQAISALVDEIYASSVGKPWESAISDRIFQADMWSKISRSKGEGGEAGASTLVYQISSFMVSEGLGLDIAELERELTIDQNIPLLIQKLYRSKRPQAAEKLVLKLLDNLNDMSPEIRLKTAQVLDSIPEILRFDQELGELAIAYEMKNQLLQRLEKERELTEVYSALSRTLARLAERFILNRDYGASTEIIDTFWRHYSSPELRKPEQRKIAMESISSIATPELLNNLANVLREGDVDTITEVANILIRFENKSIQPLIQVLKESEDILVRKITFDALEYIGKDAIKTLINDLEKYNPWHMYRNIISILAEIGNRSIIQSLGRFIKHQNPEVRRETIRAIAKIHTPETVSLLLEGLKDRDEEVLRESCAGLGKIADISTAPELLEIIKPPRSLHYERKYSPSVQAAAIWALGQIGDVSAIPFLGRILKKKLVLPWHRTGAEETRTAAARALGQIGTPECKEILTKFSHDRNEEVRRAVYEALRIIQTREKTKQSTQETLDLSVTARTKSLPQPPLDTRE
jgi:HEAT repeat protein